MGQEWVTFRSTLRNGRMHHHVAFSIKSIQFYFGKISGVSTTVEFAMWKIPKILLNVKHEEMP